MLLSYIKQLLDFFPKISVTLTNENVLLLIGLLEYSEIYASPYIFRSKYKHLRVFGCRLPIIWLYQNLAKGLRNT